jgi:hypothetical protein
MKLFNREELTACFRRSIANQYVEVYIPEDAIVVRFMKGEMEYDIGRLGERDLRQIVTLLEAQKSTLIKHRNFPDAFGELLTSLKSAVEERYGGLPKK